MNKWNEAAFEYFADEKIPVCPVCGADSVKVTKGENGKRMWVDFLCKECGNGDHFDGYLEQ